MIRLHPTTQAAAVAETVRPWPALTTIRKWSLDNDVVVVGVTFFAAASALSNDFLTWRNIGNLLTQSAMLGILATGQYLVVLTGGFDLSVASIMALSSVLLASYGDNSLGVGICLAIAAALACGLANGLAVTIGRVQPLMATLAMMGISRGLAYTVSERSVLVSNPWLEALRDPAGLVPTPALIWLVMVAIVAAWLRFSRFGLHVFAVGGGETSARLAGVKTGRVKLIVYSLSGLMSGLAGVVLVIRTGSGVPTGGVNWELDTIAAIVIGGTRLFGGEGALLKAMIGVVIYQMIANIMNLIGLDPFYQNTVRGLLLVSAVGLGILREAKSGKRMILGRS